MESLKKAPPNLSPAAARAFSILAEHTSFPGPVLIAQLKRHGLDPGLVDERGVALAIDDLAEAVGKFTTPGKGAAAGQALRAAFAAG